MTKKSQNVIFIVVMIGILLISFGILATLDYAYRIQFDWLQVSNNLPFTASPSAIIEEREFSLEGILIIDHMPTVGENRDYIYGIINVIPADEVAFPEDLSLARVWITNGKRTFTKGVTAEDTYIYPNRLTTRLGGVYFTEYFCEYFRTVYVQLIYQNSENYYLVDYRTYSMDVY